MYVLLSIAVVVLDQLSKSLVVRYMVEGRSVVIIPGILCLTRVENPGAAFGLFSEAGGFVIVASIALLVSIIANLRRLARARRGLQLGVSLAVGGAFGNLVDRIYNGAVIDFIDLAVWPIFNLADVAIVAGAGAILWMVTIGAV